MSNPSSLSLPAGLLAERPYVTRGQAQAIVSACIGHAASGAHAKSRLILSSLADGSNVYTMKSYVTAYHILHGAHVLLMDDGSGTAVVLPTVGKVSYGSTTVTSTPVKVMTTGAFTQDRVGRVHRSDGTYASAEEMLVADRLGPVSVLPIEQSSGGSWSSMDRRMALVEEMVVSHEHRLRALEGFSAPSLKVVGRK